jgi:TetR/AcrR family transcriptional regulator, transcriptional repressor for nem operon
MRRASRARSQTDTAEEILDIAQNLIQTRGYSAFSYQDIADALKIRKASIHYHFPAKTDLGIAVIDRYTRRFGEALTAIAADPNRTSMDMLDCYVEPYLEFARTADKVCLCGALAGEMLALPADLRTRVERFFKQHQAWLADILKRGAERGEFTLRDKPLRFARLIFGALQGGLLVKRTTRDASQLLDVVAALKSQLAAAPAR